MRNAAAPSVGGESSAPMPAADRIAPAVSAGYPAPRSSGQDTEPSITVVATPLPDTVPRRKPATRHGAARRCARARPAHGGHRPVDEEARPAPECSSTAP